MARKISLKLIYTLVEEGVLKLNASQYYSLYLIYLTPTEQLTQEQLLAFKEIISNATVNSTKAITLIGEAEQLTIRSRAALRQEAEQLTIRTKKFIYNLLT